MEWNLFSLKVFSEVARQKNFTKAAKILGLTQPAVSLQVQNLEKQTGCPLLIRKRTGEVTLTEAGRVVLRYTETLEKMFQNLQKDLEPWTSARNRTLVLGCCCIAGEYIVPSYTVAFRRIYPRIGVQCHVGRCTHIFERILDGSLDLAVTGIPPCDSRLVHLPFVHMPLTCFEAPRTLSRRLSIKELVSEPLVLREAGSGTRTALEKFLQDHGLALEGCLIVATSESNEALKEMVANGMGWSILPDVVVQKELERGRLSLIEIEEGSPVQDFFVVYRKHVPMSGPGKEFTALLLQEKPLRAFP